MPKNIYAWTAPDSIYPAYLSINEWNGRIEVTVRSATSNGSAETMALPREELAELAKALILFGEKHGV